MIKNLTPHKIVINSFEFESSGIVARVSQKNSDAGFFDEIPLITVEYGEANLPEFNPDVLLIVSSMVRQACPNRLDLASPGDPIRDEKGIIIGCKNLIINK